MSDDDVIDLGKERIERVQAAGEAAHASGQAFAFAPYVYDDMGVGTIDSGEVIVVLSDLAGIRMSKADALLLAEALADVAKS